MTTLEIPVRLGPSIAREWIAAWSATEQAPELRLILPHDARLEPAGIVLLAAGIARRRQRGFGTSLSSEDASGTAASLLASVGFHHELGVESEAASGSTLPRGNPSTSAIAMRRIASLDVARKQADATRELLESLAPAVPPSTVRAARSVFEELAANIVQHSGAPNTGFGLAIADAGARRIQIAFADAGMGFVASLASNPEFTARVNDDAGAIRLALDPRVTRRGSGNIGMGLFLLSSLADRVHGDLWIATGNAILVRRAEGGVERSETILPTTGWEGAFLCLDAPVPGW